MTFLLKFSLHLQIFFKFHFFFDKILHFFSIKCFHNFVCPWKLKRLILGEIEENDMFYHHRNNLSSVPKMVTEIRKCQLSPLDLLASKRIMNFLLEWMYVRVELCLEVERGRRKSLVSTVTYELVGHITTRPMIIFSIYQQQFFTRFLETELSIGAFRTPTRGVTEFKIAQKCLIWAFSTKMVRCRLWKHFPDFDNLLRFSINEMPKITISLLLFHDLQTFYYPILY